MKVSDWGKSTPEGRWCGLGPYYAMFPTEFVRRAVETFCPTKGRVIEPFSGRGTTAFVASVSGRHALATDTNPVAWIYCSVKLDPCKRQSTLLRRVQQILELTKGGDGEAENDFQKGAWHRDVLSFLKSARRNLNWRSSRTDRTLMAIILVHLHSKLGEGLSNQMRQSKAMSPNYASEWWRERKMRPPRIDVLEFFEKKLSWRYAKGLPPKNGSAITELGDARLILPRMSEFQADFVLTSPPYFGVTNYEYDNWIRLWMLGGPSLPSHLAATRYADPEKYEDLIADVFDETRRHSKDNATIFVRTDARRFTLETTLDTLEELWPSHNVSLRFDTAKGKTQTGLFQERWNKAGEVDVLLTPRGKLVPRRFFK
jgi:hypothetical protein